MTTNNEYDDDFDTFDDEGTDVVKQLRKVNRTLEKRAKELEQELTSLKTQSRQRTVKDVLQAKGVNQKIAAFIPADIEPSEEAIVSWLSEYGDVFGVTANADSQQASETKVDLNAQNRINNLVATGQAPSIDEDAMAKIMNATSPEELNRILGISVQ